MIIIIKAIMIDIIQVKIIKIINIANIILDDQFQPNRLGNNNNYYQQQKYDNRHIKSNNYSKFNHNSQRSYDYNQNDQNNIYKEDGF